MCWLAVATAGHVERGCWLAVVLLLTVAGCCWLTVVLEGTSPRPSVGTFWYIGIWNSSVFWWTVAQWRAKSLNLAAPTCLGQNLHCHCRRRECSLDKCLSLPLALSPLNVVGQMGHLMVGCCVCLLPWVGTVLSRGWDLFSSLLWCLGRSRGWDLLWGLESLPLGWGLLGR